MPLNGPLNLTTLRSMYSDAVKPDTAETTGLLSPTI